MGQFLGGYIADRAAAPAAEFAAPDGTDATDARAWISRARFVDATLAKLEAWRWGSGPTRHRCLRAIAPRAVAPRDAQRG